MKLKPFLIMGILVLAVLISALGYIKMTEPRPDSQIIKKQSQIPTEQVERTPVPSLIRQINAENSKIGSISCDEATVKIWQGGLRFKLTGAIHYEKHKRFRMKMSSAFGEEFDLGSNDNLFWYWSRRDKDPGVHWAKYEDYHKTRLKTPFNPVFMKKSLSLDVIDTDNAKIVETAEDYIVVYAEKNASNQPILVSIFVNKANKRVEGLIITDTNANPLASAEIQEYENGLPKRILYIWHEEDKALQLELTNPKANTAIPESNWTMPNHDVKLNMAEDVFQSRATEPNGVKRVYLVSEKSEESDGKTQVTTPTASRSQNTGYHSRRGFVRRRWRSS